MAMSSSTLTWTLALDFLSVEGVVEAKLVSKAARSAARTVLTRGRYQPVARCFVLMKRLGDLTSATYSFTEEDMKIIRAAWSLEPAIVAAEGILIPRKGDIICEIFDILEPSFDGLERLVAAWEHVSIEESQPWSSQSDIFCSHFQGWISRRASSQVVLSNNEDPHDQRIQTLKDARDRFWRAVERWSDLPRIVKAVYPWCGEDKEGTRATVATSRYWTDVVKIDFVVAAIRAFENERVELEVSRGGDHW